MNRALRNSQRKRCSFRKYGGGYGMGAPLVSFSAPEDGAFSVKVPVVAGYDDASAIVARPGALSFTTDVSLAQVAMAGGRSRRRRGGGCGCMRGGRRNRTAKRGGGFAVDPIVSVGGTGPNVGAMYTTLPCDPRAGTHNAIASFDPRAPAGYYSLTPNQSGGAPVYNTESAGFEFRPSNVAGATLPDGVTVFNEVVPVAARMGGARRSRKHRSRKHRSRRNRKDSRKH